MTITLISLGLSTDAIGPRILSALLKQQGHTTRLVFLPTLDDLRRKSTREVYFYSDPVIDRLVELCRDSRLVGLSVMTHHQSVATTLTRTLKKRLPQVSIIWGGIHPTVCPTESLAEADLVAVGEAEQSLPELARRLDAGGTAEGVTGIGFRRAGQPVLQGHGLLAEDLDALPFPDYSFENHHLLVGDELRPMTVENWRAHLLKFFPPLNCDRPKNPAYQVLSARGCPFRCSFCGELPLLENGLYGPRYFRRRSVANLLQELEWAQTAFPFIGEICFCDDTFASRPHAELEAFAAAYKQRIGLPFYILVSPANVEERTFDLLVDAGLTNVGMGIQSGSSRILALYNRDRGNHLDQIYKAARILNRYRGRLRPYYDFIVENPYETRDDLLATLRVLINLPRPYQTRVYALSFFPGTPLYAKARTDGMVHADLYDKTFGQRTRGGYLEFMIDMNRYRLPQALLRLLIARPLLWFFNRPAMDRLFLAVLLALKWVAMKTRFREHGLS